MTEPAKNTSLESGVDEQPVRVITFIHGTLVLRCLREPRDWCGMGSELRKTLQNKFPTAIFKVFCWSGRNNHVDRQKAAVDLRTQLQEQVKAYPHATHVLIAHSHGGNIALHAISETFLHTKIRTVICLNTPFLVALRRPSSLFFASILSISFAILNLLYLLVGAQAFMILQAFWGIVELRQYLIRQVVLDISSFIVLSLLLYYEIRFIIWLAPRFVAIIKGVITKVENKIERLIRNVKLPDFGHGMVIVCLWSIGDEIYEVFSFLGTLGNVPYNLLRPQIIILMFIFTILLQLYNTTYVTHFFSDTDKTVQMAVEVLRPLAATPALTQFIENTFNYISDTLYYVDDILASTVMYGIVYIVSVEILALLLNAAVTLIPFGAGALGIWDSHYVRLATTLTPATSARIIFEEFETLPSVSRGLMHLFFSHSAIYETDAVITRICKSIEIEPRSGTD